MSAWFVGLAFFHEITLGLAAAPRLGAQSGCRKPPFNPPTTRSLSSD